MKKKDFTFARFSAMVGKIAENHFRKEDVIKQFKDRLATKGRKFSLVEDGQMDSLDITETVMELEEMLVDHEGPDFRNLKMEGKDFDEAKNVGDFYEAICKQLNVKPDYAAAA